MKFFCFRYHLLLVLMRWKSFVLLCTLIKILTPQQKASLSLSQTNIPSPFLGEVLCLFGDVRI